MFSDDLAKSRMLSVWDVIEKGYTCRTTKHSKNSVNLSGKDCTFGEFLSTQSSFIYFNWPRKFNIRQHLSFHKKAACFSD